MREFGFKPKNTGKVIDLVVSKKRFGLYDSETLASPTTLCVGRILLPSEPSFLGETLPTRFSIEDETTL